MIHPFETHLPEIHPSARIARNATLAGDVTVDERASIWYGAVLRGDEDAIRVGAESNIQDNAVLHCEGGCPMVVGRRVTVGHGAILHGCTVEDGALIGMGAILLNNCVIGAGSLVAAGALVTQGTVVPPGSLVVGAPARVKRPLRPEELEELSADVDKYLGLAEQLPLYDAAYGGRP